jgi:hypothetical protein
LLSVEGGEAVVEIKQPTSIFDSLVFASCGAKQLLGGTGHSVPLACSAPIPWVRRAAAAVGVSHFAAECDAVAVPVPVVPAAAAVAVPSTLVSPAPSAPGGVAAIGAAPVAAVPSRQLSKRFVYMVFALKTPDGQEELPERVVFEMFRDALPITSENFRCLCTGEQVRCLWCPCVL